MITVLAAILALAEPFVSPSPAAELRFVTVAPSPAGRIDEFPFDRASNRYALVVEGPNGDWAAQARLGAPDSFSPLQSSETLALPPGRYGVRLLPGEPGDDAAPEPQDILFRLEVREGARYEVRCTAYGTPFCDGARRRADIATL